MIEAKNALLGLDLDTAYHLLGRDRYVQALNITKDATADNQDGAVTNVVGNRLVTAASYNPYNLQVSLGLQGASVMGTFTFTSIPNLAYCEVRYYTNAQYVGVKTVLPENITTVGGNSILMAGFIRQIPYDLGVMILTVYYTDGTSDTFCPSRFIQSLPAGQNKVIGAVANPSRDTVLYLVYNSTGHHGIYEYSNRHRTVERIFEALYDSTEDILGFEQNKLITSINILNTTDGDMLYFLDTKGRPTVIDIDRLRVGFYKADRLNRTTERAYLDAAKCPPLLQPQSVAYSSDATRRVNNLKNKLFRFKYRYVFHDGTKSTFSPASSVVIPPRIGDATYSADLTHNNTLSFTLEAGSANVRYVEVCMSYVNRTNEWSDFALVERVDKWKATDHDQPFTYTFYNDSAYPAVDINESTQLFDYVPQAADAQEIANNVVVYAGITEGYDKDLEADVTLNVYQEYVGNNQQNAGTLVCEISQYTGYRTGFTFSGNPPVGTVVKLSARRRADGAVLEFANCTVANQSQASAEWVAHALYTSALWQSNFANISHYAEGARWFNAEFDPREDITDLTFHDYYEEFPDSGKLGKVEITFPADASDFSDARPSWKWSTERRFGLQYFDEKGRTNGVLYESKVAMPAYAEDGAHLCLLPYVGATVRHQPPLWAHSFGWVVTKEPTYFFQWHTADVKTAESEYLYFDVSNIKLNQKKQPTVSTVLDYSFSEGDRLRLIRRMADGVVYSDAHDAAVEGLVVDPVINGAVTTGTFIKVKKIAPLSGVDFSSKYFIIEVYRPQQAATSGANEAFYEFGYNYPVLNPGTPSRAHSGVTDQNIAAGIPAYFQLTDGDVYFHYRRVVVADTAGVTSYGAYFCMDRNAVDTYISAVSSVDGRPTLIDPNARRGYYPTLIRHSREYQQGTNINGTNRFFANNYDEYPLSYGAVVRLRARDRYLHVFQQRKVGTVPIYSEIAKDASGGALKVVTDKFLNPIQYYAGEWGMGSAVGFLVSAGFADYFCDDSQGVVCRLSQDGIVPISITGRVHSWASKELPLRKGSAGIIGAYVPQSNRCLIALPASGGSAAQTMVFDEKANAFEGLLSLFPECMVTLGGLLIAFKEGQLYTHDSATYNNFFGTQYDSEITVVFNPSALEKKTFQALSEAGNRVWECPTIYTNTESYPGRTQESNLVPSDFEAQEGAYHAALLGDKYSPGGLADGEVLKGHWCAVKFKAAAASAFAKLAVISLRYSDSPKTTT